MIEFHRIRFSYLYLFYVFMNTRDISDIQITIYTSSRDMNIYLLHIQRT